MEIPHLWCPVPVVARALEPRCPHPRRCRLPGAQKAPRPAFLANGRFSFFLCCRFLKVKEPEPGAFPGETHWSACLRRPGGTDCSGWAGVWPRSSQPEGTPHACSCLPLLFSLHSMLLVAQLLPWPSPATLGAGLPPTRSSPLQDHGRQLDVSSLLPRSCLGPQSSRPALASPRFTLCLL